MRPNETRPLDLSEASTAPNLSRREFIKAIGGGIVVFFWLGGDSELDGQRRRPPADFNAYLRIAADGSVSCFTGKIEMGQGVITSLAQMLAEELDVSVESIDMVMGDTARCPYDAGTWGSMSTPYFGEPILRAAGAKARAILMELAAARLDVPKERLDV
ncbi:MAG: molybdopterin-dependent oxidoreductase, partial [Phycisphaerales bacterium]